MSGQNLGIRNRRGTSQTSFIKLVTRQQESYKWTLLWAHNLP